MTISLRSRFSGLKALFAAAALALIASVAPHAALAQDDPAQQLLLGNPSGATSSTSNYSNYLISRPQYALAYSRDDGIPKWVSWHLAPPDLGSATRTTSFYTDTTLPSSWYHVTSSDYTNSGYDRGHNCASADRTASASDNKQLFYMTNILPQAPDNNQGPWEALEDYCRDQVINHGQECYIITCWDTKSTTIAGGKVTVPKYYNKIIVVMPLGDDNASGDDLSRINANTTVIAVSMPNVQGIRDNSWTQYICTVNQIESYTGYKFFSNLPASVQTALKSKKFVP